MEKEESISLIEKNSEKLQLNNKQFQKWAGKRYLVLIEVEKAAPVQPFQVDKSEYSNMDDWLPVEDIEKVKIPV
jgi:hypothetical protein